MQENLLSISSLFLYSPYQIFIISICNNDPCVQPSTFSPICILLKWNIYDPYLLKN